MTTLIRSVTMTTIGTAQYYLEVIASLSRLTDQDGEEEIASLYLLHSSLSHSISHSLVAGIVLSVLPDI